jgi:uncharacterized protein (DUF1697 family)
MTYVALLRGINVGGNSKVAMPQLKQIFEQLGFEAVRTFINSGNVIFQTDLTNQAKLTKQIEAAIEQGVRHQVRVLLRDLPSMAALVKALPKTWVNDQVTKCDVLFLWKAVDSPKILKELPTNPEIEDVKYAPGAVIWRIDRDKATKSRMSKLVGTDLYKNMTARNPNTVRKLHNLMREIEG